MRSREEIQEEILESNAEKNSRDTVALLQLEVLQDIRDQHNKDTQWGIYCPQHFGSWYQRIDGTIYFYPAAEIAEAHLEVMKRDNAYMHRSEHHLYEVCEFGKQRYVSPVSLSAGSAICPVRMPPHYSGE